MLGTQDFRSKAQLFSYLAETSGKPGTRSVHFFLMQLDSRFTLDEAFERARKRGLQVGVGHRGTDVVQVGLGVRTSYETGYLVPIEDSWLFVSDGETAKLSSTLQAFTRNLAPIIRLAYVPSHKMLRLIEGTKPRYDTILVTEGTIWTLGQTFRNWKKQSLPFSAKVLEQRARKDEGKWTGLSFKCMVKDDEVLNCRVYERGHLTLYRGDFPKFYSDILIRYLAESLGELKSLEGHERTYSKGQVKLFPVTFSVPKRITPADMDFLKGKIVNRYIASVTHPGNPMLMLQLCDQDDGSTYDLYVFSDKVQIVPLQRASPTSLSDLLSIVSDIFPTGTLAAA